MNTIPIVYENENIYIIHKPQGLATQGGQGVVHSVDTLFSKQVGKKIFLVHRLDKDTEGLLIIAKDSSSARTWTELIAGKEIQKEYYAVCAGEFSQKKGQITESITHKGSIKQALTYYNVESTATFSHKTEEKQVEYTLNLVRLRLGTGRMHQIRIHLAKIGNPIAGDDKYGDFKLNKTLKKVNGIKKLCLTAVQLTIPTKHLEKSNSEESILISISMPDNIKKICTV